MKNRCLTLIVAILTCVVAGPASQANVLPFDSYTVDGSNNLTGFTTDSVTYSDVTAATSASGGFSTAEADRTTEGGVVDAGGDADIDNLWLQGGTEINGVAAILNLNIGNGVINSGRTEGMSGITGSFDVFFGVDIVGRPGDANDMFIMEMSGNDDITITALDGDGNVIGTQDLVVDDPVWGGGVTAGTYLWEVTGGPSDQIIQGIAFDLEDFFVGTPETIGGLRISGDGLDAVVFGYTTTAAIPEPASLALLGIVSVAMIRRRRSSKN